MSSPQPLADDHRLGLFSFEPLRHEHLPLLARWLAAEHVSPWFGPSANANEDPIGERDAVRRFIASRDERPIGLIQIYRWTDFPDNAAAVGARSGEVGIDYLIGERDLIGQGVGPDLIRAFLARFASGRGDVMGVRVDVAEANERSWRCLQKVGFRRDRSGVRIGGQQGRHYVYVLDGGSAAASADVERVAALIRSVPRAPGMRCRVLGIDGPGGSGKSTLAIAVARALGDAPVVHTDDFASWETPFDWYLRLLDQILRPLAGGALVRYQRYDWDSQRLADWHELDPGEFLIVEGVGASRRALRPYLSATVWVQTGRAERLRRGLARDGQDALPLWQEWMRAEDDYVATERPDQAADLIVSGDSMSSNG